AAMESTQHSIADAAIFGDDLDVDADRIRIDEPISLDSTSQSGSDGPPRFPVSDGTAPVIVGVDQAFEDDTAISAVVAIQGREVLTISTARTPLESPYIPGLLAFREGPPIIEALQSLSVEPDIVFFDGSGRIHFRQAGIATHVGVIFDVPSIGVAKNPLCGTPDSQIEAPLPAGATIPIRADASVDAPQGTILGYAFQSKQFENPRRRHVNPLYVSPGHRASAETAVTLTQAVCAGYKLPEPTRLADRVADDFKA
ncbi:MAG: endonuclease V, partial [Halodesulfurarchaeum sp.]